MARIIEQGYLRLTCNACKSLIEYTRSEVKRGEFNMDYLGDSDTEDYIDCPSCQHKCIIKLGPHGY